jgi:N-acetylneuraminic acid mutarotase
MQTLVLYGLLISNTADHSSTPHGYIMKTPYIASLICALIVLCLQSCKKNEAVHRPQEASIKMANTADTAPSTFNEIAVINWSAAQGQLKGTHEIHGEAVNGKLYIFGGFDVNKMPATFAPTKRAYRYDPVAGTWAPIKSMPYLPNGDNFGGATHMGVTTDGADIYFAGGYISNAAGTGQTFGTDQVWKYIVATDSYIRLPNLPQPLAAGQLRYLNGLLHYMGGANLSRQDINTHYVLNLADPGSGWTLAAPLLDAVNHPGSAVLNGKIYFIGGAHHQDENTVTQKTMQVYTPETDSWQRLADMPKSVDHISSAVITLNNRILVLGGELSHNVLSNAVQMYNPETNIWTELTPLPSARSAGVAAVLNGNIYYTGGNFSTVNRKGVPVYGTLPLADALVRSGDYAAVNYGADTSLAVKATTNVSFNRKSYLKFSVGSLNNYTSVKLRIYGYNADNSTTNTVYCYAVDNDNWAENTINFNNAPASVGQPISTASITSNKAYLEFDVTTYVRSQQNTDNVVTLLLKDKANKNLTYLFNSKENKLNKPVLVIN